MNPEDVTPRQILKARLYMSEPYRLGLSEVSSRVRVPLTTLDRALWMRIGVSNQDLWQKSWAK